MLFKKSILLLSISFLFFSGLRAQNNDSLNLKKASISTKTFYFQIGLGYNFSSGLGTFSNNVTNADGSYSKENVLGSFGKGFDLSLGLGKMVTKSLGIEMDLGYMGGGVNAEDNKYYISNTPTPYTQTQHGESKANTFRINPKFVFEIPFEKINAFYGKIGYLIGFGNQTTTHTDENAFDNGNTGNSNYSWVRTGGIVSGSSMALGVRFKLENDISFFMELTGNNLHRTFKRETMTDAVENGTSTLSSLSVSQTETVYVKNATTAASPDKSQPYQYPAFRSNYSTVGFRMGIIAHF